MGPRESWTDCSSCAACPSSPTGISNSLVKLATQMDIQTASDMKLQLHFHLEVQKTWCFPVLFLTRGALGKGRGGLYSQQEGSVSALRSGLSQRPPYKGDYKKDGDRLLVGLVAIGQGVMAFS